MRFQLNLTQELSDRKLFNFEMGYERPRTAPHQSRRLVRKRNLRPQSGHPNTAKADQVIQVKKASSACRPAARVSRPHTAQPRWRGKDGRPLGPFKRTEVVSAKQPRKPSSRPSSVSAVSNVHRRRAPCGINRLKQELGPRALDALAVVVMEAAQREEAGVQVADPMPESSVELRPTTTNAVPSAGHRNADYYSRKGYECRCKGDLRSAIDFYDRALEYDPRDFRTLFNRGYALELLGESQAAAYSYQAARKLQPGNAFVHFNLGNCMVNLGKMQLAVQCYDRAIERDAEQPTFYRARALAHRRNRHSVVDGMAGKSSRVNSHSKNGDYDAAIRDYVEARACEARVKERAEQRKASIEEVEVGSRSADNGAEDENGNDGQQNEGHGTDDGVAMRKERDIGASRATTQESYSASPMWKPSDWSHGFTSVSLRFHSRSESGQNHQRNGKNAIASQANCSACVAHN